MAHDPEAHVQALMILVALDIASRRSDDERRQLAARLESLAVEWASAPYGRGRNVAQALRALARLITSELHGTSITVAISA